MFDVGNVSGGIRLSMKVSTGAASSALLRPNVFTCPGKRQKNQNIDKSNTTLTKGHVEPIQYKYTVVNAESHVMRHQAWGETAP